MKIGLFSATYLDTPLQDVATMAADLGYQALELPAFAGNPHLDIEEIVKGANAKALLKMLSDRGLVISALANHPEGQIVLGPYGKDTDAICRGTKEEKIAFGTARMVKTAQAANALGVPVVTGFLGCENFGRFFPWPYSKGWADMEQEMVERWGKILDKFGEYGVKFAHEPHPNELVYDVDTALRAVELFGGRKEFGFNFDPANLIYLDINVENFIDHLKDRILHVHAKD
ncbi:MAG TPA: sugar phosphate isomerase/epimerase family protein, partial [Spirochaetia bacterium]|nr:sugar phosphate isomerase/epimerase family protein [Spirochaetia bacterium]